MPGTFKIEGDAFSQRASTLLKALANDKRLLILCKLREGEMPAGSLHEDIGVSQSALSQHLGWLRRQGIVQTRRSGNKIYYSVANGPANSLLEVLCNIYEHKQSETLVVKKPK